MPYRKIVCSIGEAASSRAAFEFAARTAHESRALLYLVRVIPSPGTRVSERALLEHRWRAHHALQAFAEELPVAQGRVLIVRFGNPAREIEAFARRVRADLIVIGGSGRSAIARLFRNSIAQKLLNHAPCPVLSLPANAALKDWNIAAQAA